MRYEFKSISLWSVIRVSFFLNTVIGFMLGILFAFFLSIYITAATALPGLAAGGFDFSESSFGAILIFFPLIGAACGAVFHTFIAMVFCLAYNLISRITGGLEFDLKPVGASSGKSETIISPKPTPTKETSIPSIVLAKTPPPPPPFATGRNKEIEEKPQNTSPIPPPPSVPDSSPDHNEGNENKDS